MPKVSASRGVGTIRATPVDNVVRIKTVNRTRTKKGRAASTNVMSTLSVLEPDPMPPPSNLPDLYPDDTLSGDEREVLVGSGNQKAPSKAVSAKLAEWLPWREEFLDELLRSDGLGGHPLVCAICGDSGNLRCKDCSGHELFCNTCMVTSHSRLPLHRIERWNGQYFSPELLGALGLTMQLGHPIGKICQHHSRPYQFTVFDLTGVHQVVVRYCECIPDIASRRRQLLKARWFPATLIRLHTVFTFRLLNFFHQLQSHNKTNLYDFYNTIIHLSNNAGLSPEVYRYNEISLVYRMWVHLHILKRGGAAHHPGGIESLLDGSMAVECPACPHPGRNVDADMLANDWKCTLAVSLDACFKLKLKDRSFNDPDLGTRLAYMVGDHKYRQHLSNCSKSPLPRETLTCGSMLHAVNDAHTKSSHGYLATGVVISSCRHAFVRSNGAADLQRGERYINTDYAFASSIVTDLNSGVRRLLVTYDIGCQWGINLQRRLSTYTPPLNLDLRNLTSFRVAVPKFHLIGHGASCQVPYNLALMDGVGLTHGEGVETVWSHSTSLATWSRENGPAARHQILDDHWGSWNWRKTCNSRSHLRKTLDKAWKWSKAQREVAGTLDATVPSDTLRKWRKMVSEYKQDKSQPNPFEEPEIAASVNSLRCDILREESNAQKMGAIQLDETSPGTFLRRILDIEEKQRVLQSRYRTASPNSVYQRESLQDQRKTLTQAIDNIRSPQRIYIPGCSALLDDIDPETVIDSPESVKLWLPSALPHASRNVWCISGLPVLEFRLRYAQAIDALDQLRRLRCLVRGLWLQAQKHPSPTEGTRTRSRSVFDGLQMRITQVCSRYRDARVALLRLHPSGGWTAFFKELKKEDIRGPGREQDEPSESCFIPSWIWILRAPPTPPDLPGSSPESPAAPHNLYSPTTLSTIADNEDDQTSAQAVEDYILIDWAKAHERAKRFEEEVEMCVEEMRRTLVFFSWSASEWERRAKTRTQSDNSYPDEVLQGLQAYAYRQSAMFRKMITVFVNDWSSCLTPKGLGNKWLVNYSDLITPRNGRNTIPSIISPALQKDTPEANDVLSDQDEVLDPPVEEITEQDAESELHNDFVQVMAEV